MGHIRKRDGFLGLYAGFGPRILEMGAAHYTTVAFNKVWRWKWKNIFDDAITPAFFLIVSVLA